MIDPQAKAVLDELDAKAAPMPADEDAWLAGYRDELDAVVAMQPPPPPVASDERTVRHGDVAVPMRLYRPLGSVGALPTFLFLHGGGFVAGSLKGYEQPLRSLATRSGWQVAALAYRLAPEHPYPAAVDDGIAAVRLLARDCACDGDRLVIGGDSAGGLLATVVARRARDSGGPPLAGQILLYPNTDLRYAPPHASRRAFDGKVVRIDELHRSLDLYLRGADRTQPEVSPLLADDLGGLPPALVVVNECDPLRDEAEAYAARLEAAGVPVTLLRLKGMIHTALQRAARIDRGDALIDDVAAYLEGIEHGRA